jgi:hypothetical protein
MNKKSLLSIFLLVLLISSCNEIGLDNHANETNNNINPTLVLTKTNTPHTPKPIQAQTSTSYPTLTYQIQDDFFDLLSNNGNCKLPCFWGITPSTTSWSNANNILERYVRKIPIPLDQTSTTKTNSAYSAYIKTTKDVTLLISLIVNVNKSNIVSSIIFRTEIFQSDFPDLDTYDKHLIWYSPTEIFKKHGPPDNLYLYISPSGDYSLGIVYENLKAVILLTGFAKENINNKRAVCPNIGDGDVSYVNIASTTDSIDVKTLIGYPFWEGVPPFEEVAGMSVEDFYKLIISSSEQPICFEVQ